MMRAQILELIPHSGAMCLLDEVIAWDAQRIHCRSRSHRNTDHPLRRQNSLAVVHLVEYGAQAVAVHGALRARDRGHSTLDGGLLAGLRDVTFGATGDIGAIEAALDIVADCELAGASGLIYRFAVSSDQTCLAKGRLTIAGG